MRDGVRDEVGRIPALDGMRGIAVLWVVAFHYIGFRQQLGDPWIAALARVTELDRIVRNGYLGVDLFFLLSGFLLALPWFLHARAGRPPPSARGFYERRVRRIVPAYYVQLVLLFVLVMPLLHGRSYWKSDLWVYLWNAVAHGLFIQNTTPLTGGSMNANGALWTLAVEVQFYVLMPLMVPLVVRAPRVVLAVALAITLWWQWAVQHDLRLLVDAQLALGAHWHWSEEIVRYLLTMQLPGYVAHFALGMVLGRAWLALRDGAAPRWLRALLGPAAIAAPVVVWLALAHSGGFEPGHARLVAAAALGVLLLGAAASDARAVRAVLGRGPLAFAGRVSYSAYLYHVPLLLIWNAWAKDVDGRLALPAFMTLLAAVSWLSWRYVEQPFLRSGSVARTVPDRERGEDREDLQERHAP